MPLNELVTSDADFEVEDNQPAVPAETPTREASPAPAERAQPDDDDIETGEPEAKKADEQKPRPRSLEGRKQTIQEQINELVREKGSNTRENAEIKAETARLRAERDEIQRAMQSGRREPEGQPAARATETDPAWGRTNQRDVEPQEDQFDDFGAYVRAQSSWAAREAVRVQHYRQAEAREGHSRQQFEESRQKAFAGRYQEFARVNATFEAEVNREDLDLTAPMVDVIKDSDVGPQMMLFLARHPDEVDRLAALHPVLAYGEMKKHEARLEAAYSGSAQAKTGQLSKARPPIRPVDSAGAASDDGEPSDDMDMDAFIERGNALEKQRRRTGQRL